LVHCFAIPRYRSSLSLIRSIEFSRSYGPWTLKNITNYRFSALSFLFLLTDTHLIFGTLLRHTKLQIKFEFGLDPLIFHEVMALGHRKILRMSVFLHFCSPLPLLALQSQMVAK
jgi:hypothetical protein